MTCEEEILLKEYFRYENMSKDDRDLCINLIRNCKEVTDSEVLANSNSSSKFDVVSLNLKKVGQIIYFNGAIANDTETKWIDGLISRKANKYYVANNIYRMYEYLEDEEKDYSSLDIFVVGKDKLLRQTHYTPQKGYYEAELEPLDYLELYEYYEKKIHRDALKRDLK